LTTRLHAARNSINYRTSDTMEPIATRIRNDVKHLGVARTAYEVFMTAINLCVDLRIIKVIKREVVNPDFLESDEAFQWQFLDESQMFELARHPDYHLTESFVQTALEKGDECYACFDGDELACFGWYSNKPTDDEGLTFHFSPDYIYGYAAFTHPKYRGRRLHTIRICRALREYLDRGFKGVVSAVYSHNFRSLRAAARSGCQDIGYIFVLKIGGHAWIHVSRGCRQYGIYLAKPAAAQETVFTGR
jgi:Acetyltransferase (GNAT) family